MNNREWLSTLPTEKFTELVCMAYCPPSAREPSDVPLPIVNCPYSDLELSCKECWIRYLEDERKSADEK